MSKKIRLIAIVGAFVFHAAAVLAEEISLDLSVVANDAAVLVTAHNRGTGMVPGIRASLELDGEVYHRVFDHPLLPGEARGVEVHVKLPTTAGTYPLTTNLYYRNDGVELSVVNVGYFHHRVQKSEHRPVSLEDVEIRGRATTIVEHDQSHTARLVLPAGFEVDNQQAVSGGTLFTLRNLRPQFSQNAAFFAVLADQALPPKVTIVSGRLKAKRIDQYHSMFQTWQYGLSLVAGFLAALFYFRRFNRTKEASYVILGRWAFGVFLISLFFLTMRLGRVIPDLVLGSGASAFLLSSGLPNDVWVALSSLLEWLYFNGPDYDYFHQYIGDPLYLYMLFGNYLVLRYVIKPDPKSDKYWHLMRSIFSVPVLRTGNERWYWSKLSKIALLALFVKAFYLPLLVSWTVNNIFHQANLLTGFTPSFEYINRFVIAGFILFDVAIFAFGYLTELPQLKNQVKSVDATLSGWAVCLICYPPFNVILFLIFDSALRDHAAAPPVGVQLASVCAITALWGIYAWATFALGARSSNLTNRGIVTWGPYRFVRHPAYFAKVLLWTIEGAFLGAMNMLLVIALLFIYYLRSMTEERHLNTDPDYQTYKRQVPYRFIPKVI